jgi:hypothetical protein
MKRGREPFGNTESNGRAGRARVLAVSVLAAAGLTAAVAPAFAQEKTNPVLGLPPSHPQAGPMAGGVTPAYHRPPVDANDWRFDFHGYLTVPLRAGIGENPNDGGMTLHAPPVIPDYRDNFNYTGTVPQSYVQLLFSYGNKIVTGNISIVSLQPKAGASYFDPPLNPGIVDAYLNFNLAELMKNARFDVNVGAYSNRYGVMGEYDEGRYGTPVIARINGIGETVGATFAFGDLALMLEQGIHGQGDKPWAGIEPNWENDFADERTGASWVTHFHAGVGYGGFVTLGGHYLTAFTQDDRATQNDTAEGRVNILGADLRLTLGRFGHLYVAGAQHDADRTRTLGRVVDVLNARGGSGLIQNYFGPESGGTGKLLTIAAQYDLSIASLLYYPRKFTGESPDLVLSLFGMQTKVDSDDKSVDDVYKKGPIWDGITKRKFGAEASYSVLPWLAFSARFDHVAPDVDFSDKSFSQISPRLLLRTGWNARDQVAIQYSRFFYGNLATVRDGYPPQDSLTTVPDDQMVAITASMWW